MCQCQQPMIFVIYPRSKIFLTVRLEIASKVACNGQLEIIGYSELGNISWKNDFELGNFIINLGTSKLFCIKNIFLNDVSK